MSIVLHPKLFNAADRVLREFDSSIDTNVIVFLAHLRSLGHQANIQCLTNLADLLEFTWENVRIVPPLNEHGRLLREQFNLLVKTTQKAISSINIEVLAHIDDADLAR